MAATKNTKEMRFDQAKLQNMQEPLQVRVEKLRGSVKQPIELPSKDGSAPGTNWTRDEVLKLENFILNEWAGGGYYEFSVTDARGETMSWSGVWDPRLYAEKIPPNTLGAAMANPNGPPQMPTNVQPIGSGANSSFPAAYSNNPPHYGPTFGGQPQQQAPQTPVQSQQVMPPQMAYQQGFMPGYAPNAYGQMMPWGQQMPYRQQRDPEEDSYRRRRALRDDDEVEKVRREGEERQRQIEAQLRRESDERQKQLEAQLRQAELDRKEMEHRQALQQLQQQSAAQMQALQDEVRRLADHKPKAEDDEIRRVREEEARRREEEAHRREEEARRAREERELLQKQLFEQQVLAMRQAQEQQIMMLREQIARMAEKPTGESDEIRRLREMQERQQQEFQREQERQRSEAQQERQRYEQERRDADLRLQIKEQQEAFRQELAQLQNNKGDPMIDALRETTRMQVEQMREMGRMQQDQTNRMSTFMVAPAQLAQIMKDGSSGTDAIIKNIVGSVDGIVNMYRNVAEHAVELAGGGPGDPPVVRMLEQGMGRASEIAERYLAVKRDQVISEGKVKSAQAQAVTAQFHARTAQVQAQARAVSSSGGGLNGAPVPSAPPEAAPAAPAAPQGIPRRNAAVAAGAPPQEVVDVTQQPQEGVGAKRPPTDEEMFGVALESVSRLRKGVEDKSLSPAQAIDAILQGVEYVVQNKLTIPAFVLFSDERWADFVDVLMPAAPQAFKDECVRILVEEVDIVHDDPPEEEKV